MMMNHLSRRHFLKLSAMVGGVAALSACAPAAPAGEAAGTQSGAGAAPAAAGNVVTYWFAWGNLAPAMDKIVETEEFKSHMEGATVEYKGSTGMDALLTAVAGGTPPDAGSNYQYVNLFTKGATIDVTDMVSASSIISVDDTLEGLWQSSFWQGKMMGVPGIEGYLWWGLNVNSHAAQEAGLDTTTLPHSWDEVLEWHKAMTKKDDAGNLLQFGLDPYDAMANEPDFIATSFGFTWWDEETGQFDLDNERMAEGLDTLGEFIRICGPDQFAGMRQVEGQGTWGAAYNAGVQTMIMEGYWHPGETQIQMPEVAQYNIASWAPVPADRADHKIMATGAHLVVIFKDGKNYDGAFKVGEFFNTDVAQDIIFQEVGWIHGRKSWLAKVDPNTYPGLDFYIRAADEATDWLVGRRCPIYGFVTSQYTELREQVYRDLMDPTAAAAELQARALAEWEAQGF